jgi:cobyrinic acid a,c-diamide synthase
MRHLPRLAIGTLQPAARCEPALWGLIAALQAADASPLVFRSSCGFAPHDVAQVATGRPSRHLDSWAMSRSAAAQAMLRAAGAGDTALLQGPFDAAVPGNPTEAAPAGSSLDRLCEWLDLPRVALVDVRELARGGMVRRPERLDGLILDRVSDPRDAAYWQTNLEALWQTPVLGWLDGAPALRAMCETLPPGTNPSSELCEALGARLLASLRLDKLLAVANRAPPLVVAPDEWSLSDALLAAGEHRFRIAVAYDEAYCGYYPETLDLLEAAGAELCDFSPLRSGSIPDGTDVVYFGCGHPERDPERLAGNHCLKQSLRSFAAGGGRIYAEGSGLAYLCREMALPGRTVPMTGLLPATARWLDEAFRPEPTEVVFGESSWLVPARFALRGYRHTGWQIEPRGPMITYARDARQRLDVLGRGNVIGSRVLVNLAANRHLLRRFFEPYGAVAT